MPCVGLVARQARAVGAPGRRARVIAYAEAVAALLFGLVLDFFWWGLTEFAMAGM